MLNGSEKSLLIDTGLGISNIYDEVIKLTDKPVTAVATHIHWDHIGGHKYFPDFYAHGEELDWLNGKFPLSIETIREMVVDRCELPDGFDVNDYEFFQGMLTSVLADHDIMILSILAEGKSRRCILPDMHRGIYVFGKEIKAIYLPTI